MLAEGEGGFYGSGRVRRTAHGGAVCRHQHSPLDGQVRLRAHSEQAVLRVPCFCVTLQGTQVEAPVIHQVAAAGGVPGLQLGHVPVNGALYMVQVQVYGERSGSGIRRDRKERGQMDKTVCGAGDVFTVFFYLYPVPVHVLAPEETAAVCPHCRDRRTDIHGEHVSLAFFYCQVLFPVTVAVFRGAGNLYGPCADLTVCGIRIYRSCHRTVGTYAAPPGSLCRLHDGVF